MILIPCWLKKIRALDSDLLLAVLQLERS